MVGVINPFVLCTLSRSKMGWQYEKGGDGWLAGWLARWLTVLSCGGVFFFLFTLDLQLLAGLDSSRVGTDAVLLGCCGFDLECNGQLGWVADDEWLFDGVGKRPYEMVIIRVVSAFFFFKCWKFVRVIVVAMFAYCGRTAGWKVRVRWTWLYMCVCESRKVVRWVCVSAKSKKREWGGVK